MSHRSIKILLVLSMLGFWSIALRPLFTVNSGEAHVCRDFLIHYRNSLIRTEWEVVLINRTVGEKPQRQGWA